MTKYALIILLIIVNTSCARSPRKKCEAAIEHYLSKNFKKGFDYKPIDFTFSSFEDKNDATYRNALRYRLKHSYVVKDPFDQVISMEEEFVVTSGDYQVLTRDGRLVMGQ